MYKTNTLILDTTCKSHTSFALHSAKKKDGSLSPPPLRLSGCFSLSRRTISATDGYRFGLKPKLEKVVYDRRASLEDTEIKKATEKLVESQFRAGSTLNLQRPFPKDSTDVEDVPQLNLVIFDPDEAWTEEAEPREKLVQWTKSRDKSAGLYPASIIWCLRKPGKELRDRVEDWLAWRRVQKEISEGLWAMNSKHPS